MRLIKCPDCGSEVSDQAVSCPKCGHPFRNVTTQSTNKKWKVTKLAAWVMIIVGAYMMISGSQGGGFQNPETGGGFTLLFLGVIVLIVGKTGAWWTNK